MSTQVLLKTCTHCKEEKTSDRFAKSKATKDLLHSWCKDCARIKGKEYRDSGRVKKRKPDRDRDKQYELTYLSKKKGFCTSICGAAKRRAKHKGYPFNLTPEFLINLWDSQQGLCAVSKQEFHTKTLDTLGRKVNPFLASLDKINPQGGYTKDNVRWVCWFVNVMKHDAQDDEFIKYIDILYYNFSNKKRPHE